jgi:hypothetical protein
LLLMCLGHARANTTLTSCGNNPNKHHNDGVVTCQTTGLNILVAPRAL